MVLGVVLLVVTVYLLYLLAYFASHPPCIEGPYGGGCPAEAVPPPPPIFGSVLGAFLGLTVVALVFGTLSGPSLRALGLRR